MIIKSNRIATKASLRRLVDHLLHGDENDHVEVLQGSERDIADYWRDAQVHAAAKALRVWILSPDEVTTREQAIEAVAAIAEEFGFEPSRATVVEHGKRRVTPESFDRHWHVVVGEVDPATGRVLSSSHDHARHEFLARLLEAKWSHRFVLGAHTKAVLTRMRRDGHGATADLLSAAFEPHASEGPPREAYTTAQHQVSKRRGTSMPQDLEAVTDAWRSAKSLSSLTAALAETGLELSLGDVEWVVRRDGVLLGSLMRLLRLRKAAFSIKMEALIHGNDIDATDVVLRRDGAVGDPTGTGRDSAVARVRRPSRQATERRREFHGGRDQAPVPPRRRDRGDPQTPGRAPRGDDRARDRASAEAGGPGGLTEAAAFVDAVVGLLPLAEALATPAQSAATAVLDRHEAEARRRLASGPIAASHANLDAAKALAEAEREKMNVWNSRIASMNDEIGTLVISQRKRASSFWYRWFPDVAAEAELDRLRARRDQLREQHRIAERPLLRSMAAEGRAEKELAATVAEAKADYVRATAAARVRLAAIARARRVLDLWPSIAYAGVRRLIDVGVRMDKARRRGWDSGPSTTGQHQP